MVRFGDGQIFGAIAVLVVLNVLGIYMVAHKPAPDLREVPFGEDAPGRRFVEIAGNTRANGIYFVPEGTTIRDLLEKAEITVKGQEANGGLGNKAQSGTRLVVNSPAGVRVERISNSRRFGLNRPMDLNAVSEKELMLVPGIGEKTAQSIIEARKISGRFASVAELGDVPGIGPRKLGKFREYFFVRSGS